MPPETTEALTQTWARGRAVRVGVPADAGAADWAACTTSSPVPVLDGQLVRDRTVVAAGTPTDSVNGRFVTEMGALRV